MHIKLFSLIRYLQRSGGISIEELQNELNGKRNLTSSYRSRVSGSSL